MARFLHAEAPATSNSPEGVLQSEVAAQNQAPMASEEPQEGGAPKSKILRVLSLQALRRSRSSGRQRRSFTLSRTPSHPPPREKQVVDETLPPETSPSNVKEAASDTPPDDDILCTEPAGVAALPEANQKGLVPRILGMLKSGLAATGDLTKLQVPPQFNMPKSQLQLYGEAIYACDQAILNACTEGATPLDRLLAVVRWHLSTVRSPLFGKAPYNPIEGETHHVSSGGLNLLAEQVSHHPPVSAIYASNPSKETRVLWQHEAAPRFTGSAIEVAIKGRRRLFLDAHSEVYELESPNLSFRLLPTPLAQWTGHTRVSCAATGLAAVVHFKGKSTFGWGKGLGVTGRVGKMGADGGVKKGTEMLNIEGQWDGLVYYTEKASKKTKNLLYDSTSALEGIHAPQVASKPDVSELESCRVWAPLSKALLASDWETSRRVKKGIEEKQREIRRGSEKAGGTFVPKYFEENQGGEWLWKGPESEVKNAPLVCQ